ncbi:MAG: hypothetical protein QXU62_03525 [Thermofilaceae archaeon]
MTVFGCAMSSQYLQQDGVKKLVEESRGEIEVAVSASEDGILLEENGANGFSDMLAALGAALAAGVDEAFRVYFNVGVERVTVALSDGRLMVVKPVRGRVVCAITKPKPRLGLVLHLLDRISEN